LNGDTNPSATPAELTSSRWGAFGHAAFTAIWTGSVIANVGTALYDTGSRWLMTSLDADPRAVSLVQVAVSLPIFLFTLPAGALADIVNPRRLLIVVELANTVMTILLATLVWSGHATVASLLLVTFFLAIGGALVAPAWMAITPLLVNRGELEGAIAANGVGYNITRAVGPVAGGFIIAGFGMAAPFFICAASNLAAIAALLWWRAPQKSAESLPAERLVSAMRTGIRHAANNRHLRATLVRAFAFFPFASRRTRVRNSTAFCSARSAPARSPARSCWAGCGRASGPTGSSRSARWRRVSRSCCSASPIIPQPLFALALSRARHGP
jgi:MFS family permease